VSSVYPIIFEPIFKPRVWGGRGLAASLNKPLPEGRTIGESWEVVDLEDEQSVVAQGPGRGKTLRELVERWGVDLLGGAGLFEGRFPLLIKFLDAREALSVQVHPDEAAAQRLGGRVRVKHEAWYIVDAQPDAFLYRGVREGVDAAALRKAVEEDRVESVLNRIPVRKGHCYYLPSGTVHALGGGVIVAEVQTPSDVTYRLYDWKRVDPATSHPRELQIEEALACVSYGPSPGEETPQHSASVWASVTRLARCASFVIERVRMVDGVEMAIPHAEMVIWIVLEGRGTIACDGLTEPLSFGVGDTVVIPAGLKKGRVATQANCMWLEVSVPIASSLTRFDRPDRSSLQDPGGGYVSIQLPDRPVGS
jgi:mannose-6-phosphate isomerase